jgi:predicted XRE-type DNA-binding protein
MKRQDWKSKTSKNYPQLVHRERAVTINKIAKGEARARTRLIWLSNPRSGKNIEDFYWKGYGAFMEFIPVVEDQARYDLVLSAAREDVASLKGLSGEIVNPEKYKGLFSFAWTVEKDDVIISKETAAEVEKVVKELTAKYDGGPLVVGVAVHEKLLRLSCAFATLCGSIVGRRLIVQPMHVQYAQSFLEDTLNKPTLDYKSFIEESKRATREHAKNVSFIRGLVTQYPAIKVLLSAQRFKGSQVQEILGVDRTEASKIISELLTRGLMKIAYNGSYQSDKILIDIARQMEGNL